MSRYFTFADYRQFGERHGYDYRIEGVNCATTNGQGVATSTNSHCAVAWA